ncbi:MAG: SEC-C domain-containing protein [bacterium]|nr:SEC-C domain-containing protein [bacterium]
MRFVVAADGFESPPRHLVIQAVSPLVVAQSGPAGSTVHAISMRPGKVGRNQRCPCDSGLKAKHCCHRGLPDPRKAIGHFVDNDQKTIGLFTRDMLVNQLRRDCPCIAGSFDRLWLAELEEISDRLRGGEHLAVGPQALAALAVQAFGTQQPDGGAAAPPS